MLRNVLEECSPPRPQPPCLWRSQKTGSDFTWPSGLAVSIDGWKLYLSVTDHDKPGLYVYDISEIGELSNRKLLLDASLMFKV